MISYPPDNIPFISIARYGWKWTRWSLSLPPGPWRWLLRALDLAVAFMVRFSKRDLCGVSWWANPWQKVGGSSSTHSRCKQFLVVSFLAPGKQIVILSFLGSCCPTHLRAMYFGMKSDLKARVQLHAFTRNYQCNLWLVWVFFYCPFQCFILWAGFEGETVKPHAPSIAN